MDEITATGANASTARSLLKVLTEHALVGVPPADAQTTATAAAAAATLALADQVAMLRQDLRGGIDRTGPKSYGA
jgi:hypothetical protein